ncbi:hypothetical protein ACWDT5_25250 [Rhodococcus aetherivorans]|jgi:hypothetical protein|uniref:SnoaL-like domain-containing protein n=1 Tax=Rhodococcus aetherivorans TaxID=191292 RepID=A0A059MH71_9NOCA|nr:MULTISPECIES: hypothetical protein [Rhodococcus]ETT26990.1 hypothetical protein RR21198_2358 [Rhodococcus rhodochrous ATCC 21198]NCL77003.1 hypothetical protein [Rhodococcus sp. YH1]AKE88089.1 hypothetical protein AAT18_01295 [Rhodococcus aetherivorans]ANZ27295.1 hypothetical protein A4U64_23420 [Rhodococcus sp. WB1]KDE10443.1 hypothetical protein N505_0126215 [Rhodococcus aetherivorans]
MSVERIALDRFFTLYGEALAGFDAEASAALWGEPGTILTDSFAGSLANRKEITEALTQSNETYRKHGLAGVGHELLDLSPVTDKIVRARVRWSFRDANDAVMATSDYEYLLRDDPDGLHAYVAVGCDPGS